MKHIKGKNLLIAVCFIIIFSSSINVYGGLRNTSVSTELFQKMLNIKGMDSEIINLDREDEFKTALFYETPNGIVIVLGFSDDGLQKGKPFLISTLTFEAIVQLSQDGVLDVIGGNKEDVVASGIIDVVECQVNAALAMVEAIKLCSLDPTSLDLVCIFDAILSGSIDQLECLFELFSD